MSRAPYIWIIPPGYPHRMVGVYDRRRSPHYLTLKAGERLDRVEPPSVLFEKACLSELRAYDCLGNNSLLPLVSPRLAKELLAMALEDVQLIDTKVIAKDGEINDYRLVNVVTLVKCVDARRSLIRYMKEAPEEITSFDRLILLDDCMGKHAFARETKKKSLLLVSACARERLASERMKGLYFADADEFFPPRGAVHRESTSRH